MVAYTRDEIISTTDLARNVATTLGQIVNRDKEKIAISKNNKLEAVLINIDEYERLKEAQEILEHLEIAKLVDSRKESSTISFEELLEKVGVSYDEL